MTVTMQNRFEYTGDHVWSFWHILRAVLARKGHLLETSLAAEIIDGFPGYTDVDIFGTGYSRHRDWEDANSVKGTLYHELGQAEAPAGFDVQLNYAVFNFLTYVFYCLNRRPDSRNNAYLQIELVIKNLFTAIRTSDDRRGSRAWLKNMFSEFGIKHPVIDGYES